MNPEIITMLERRWTAGHEVLVLTNAMRPMRRHEAALLALRDAHGDRLTLRVSLDHYSPAVHEAERGAEQLGSPRSTVCAGCRATGSRSRSPGGISPPSPKPRPARAMPACSRPRTSRSTPPIRRGSSCSPRWTPPPTCPRSRTACWGILGKSPADVMCATSRMVVHRRGEPRARVVACTLIPYDPGFDLGATLAEAMRPVLAQPSALRALLRARRRELLGLAEHASDDRVQLGTASYVFQRYQM